MRQNGVRSNVRFPYASKGMKKGGKAKKQGYDDRLDESLGARHGKKSQSYKARRKESGKKQSMKARRDESYGAWGKRKAKFGRKNKVNK